MNMNLVNELQLSAEQDDVLTVLRKTKRLASKLNRTDISDWLNAELNGYELERSLPDYRLIASTVAYNTNGYIPAGFGMMKNGIEDLPFFGNFDVPLRESISSIVAMIDGVKSGRRSALFFNVRGEIDTMIRSHLRIDPPYERQFTFLMRLNITQVTAIPDQIKDKVLDWACALEAAGVLGEGVSFSQKEKEIAHNVTINLKNCTVDQLSALGTNNKGLR
jgi:AbiTii